MPPVHGVSRVIGLISDTHGLIRPEALAALAGVERIIHAGDVGGREVIDALATIAPVDVVRGNNDLDAWGRRLPETRTLDLDGARLHLLHDLQALSVDPAAAGIQVVVTGHSHVARVDRRDGVLFVNPGSAGPRRFRLAVSVALLRLGGPGRLEAEVVPLAV